MQDKQLMIYGGFELSTPNIPTDSIYRVSLLKLFESSPALLNKLKSAEMEPLSSSSQSQSANSRALEESTGNRAPNTPNMKTSSSEGPRGGK